MPNEGSTTKAIESQTAKLPSTIYLGAAIASMGISLALKCFGKKHTALFVGQWAAPFLLLGVYNKIVKVEGHDKSSSPNDQTRKPRFEHDANAAADEPKPIQMNSEVVNSKSEKKDDEV